MNTNEKPRMDTNAGKPDHCDKCGAQLNFAGYILKGIHEAVGSPKRRIGCIVICHVCKHENSRMVDIGKEPKLFMNKE